MTSVAAPPASDACVRFADIQRMLALFTEGLTGRHLHLKPIEPPAAAARTVAGAPAAPASAISGSGMAAGSGIATDGASIHLPPAIADFTSTRHNQGAYRIAVLHQIGYLTNGTFEFDLKRAASLMDLAPEPARSAPSGPLARLIAQRQIADLERFFAGVARPALLRRLFVTLEDLRIDTALRRDYPGARGDLDRVLGHALAARPRIASLRPLAALIESLVQYTLGAARDTLLADERSGFAARMLDAAAALQARNASVYTSARVALAISAMLEPLFKRPPRALRHDALPIADLPPDAGAAQQEAGGDSGAQDDGEAEAAEEDFDGPGVDFRGQLRPDLVYRRMRGGMPGSVAQEDAEASAADAPPPTDPQGADVPPDTAASRRARATRTVAHAGPRSFLYDEWDYHGQHYLKSWCRLYEHRLNGDDFGLVDAARRRNAALARQVRRQFSFIRPESWLRVHRTSDGDEIGLDSLIEAVIDRRTGHAGHENLYIRRDRGLREVAAAFLVDMSASTDFPIPDPAAAVAASPTEHDPYIWGRFGGPVEVPPAAPRRRVIDVAREALALMCDALSALGDSHAIYGFSGDGRENVEFNLIKEFDEALSPRTWAALAAMQPRRSTRMGPAIRHAAAKLKRQPMRRRVLIIVSDGYPEDRDYGPDRRDREYGIQDTARALHEAERAGIVSFCITIDPAGHDYLRRMCAAKRYLVIDDITALPAELTKVYRALTRDADGRRGTNPGRAAVAAARSA